MHKKECFFDRKRRWAASLGLGAAAALALNGYIADPSPRAAGALRPHKVVHVQPVELLSSSTRSYETDSISETFHEIGGANNKATRGLISLVVAKTVSIAMSPDSANSNGSPCYSGDQIREVQKDARRTHGLDDSTLVAVVAQDAKDCNDATGGYASLKSNYIYLDSGMRTVRAKDGRLHLGGVPALEPGVGAHEIGHVIGGLGHNTSMSCPGNANNYNTRNNTCSRLTGPAANYEDPSSVMGYAGNLQQPYNALDLSIIDKYDFRCDHVDIHQNATYYFEDGRLGISFDIDTSSDDNGQPHPWLVADPTIHKISVLADTRDPDLPPVVYATGNEAPYEIALNYRIKYTSDSPSLTFGALSDDYMRNKTRESPVYYDSVTDAVVLYGVDSEGRTYLRVSNTSDPRTVYAMSVRNKQIQERQQQLSQ